MSARICRPCSLALDSVVTAYAASPIHPIHGEVPLKPQPRASRTAARASRRARLRRRPSCLACLATPDMVSRSHSPTSDRYLVIEAGPLVIINTHGSHNSCPGGRRHSGEKGGRCGNPAAGGSAGSSWLSNPFISFWTTYIPRLSRPLPES